MLEDPRKFNITNFTILDDYVLEVSFEDGKVQVIDFGKIKFDGLIKDLKDLDYFNKVKLNE